MFEIMVNENMCFDDESRGIKDEPFVEGADNILKKLARAKKLSYPFRLQFSPDYFDGCDGSAIKISDYAGGAIYMTQYGEGWLCPCLLKYFDTPPAEIVFRADNP